MNCPYLKKVDLSKMGLKWMDEVMIALQTNTNLVKIKVPDNERRMEWLSLNGREISFVDNFVAIKGEGVIYHVSKYV